MRGKPKGYWHNYYAKTEKKIFDLYFFELPSEKRKESSIPQLNLHNLLFTLLAELFGL